MIGPHLHSIQIENFRSINRKIEVRLDAPVILIHGQNGVGKTSFLAAIELALTGAIQALSRADPEYRTQLLHRGAEKGRVLLELRGVADADRPIDVAVSATGATVKGKLSADKASFFSERCYLAQSLLTQLLTIYQEADARVGSPLSRFVDELLGLNLLDALELGLYPARDLRNSRKLVPEYDQVEGERDDLLRELHTTRDQLATVETAIAQGEEILAPLLATLDLSVRTIGADRAGLGALLGSRSDEEALLSLTDRERQLLVLRREFARQNQTAMSMQRSELEENHRRVLSESEAWRQNDGAAIQSAVGDVQQLALRSALAELGDPAEAVADAIGVAKTESERLQTRLEATEADGKRRMEIEDTLANVRARIALLDNQVGPLSASAGSLSRALAELLPHVHGDDCPVCGRDFRELSAGPLSARVSARVAELSDQAERLSALARERAQLESQRSTLEREAQDIDARAPAPQERLELQNKVAKLQALTVTLIGLERAAILGRSLILAETEARVNLSRLASRSTEEEVLRLTIQDHAAQLGLSGPDGTGALDVLLARLETHVAGEIDRLKTRVEARRSALNELDSLNRNYAVAAQLKSVAGAVEGKRSGVNSALRAADGIRVTARRIVSAAAATRAHIVGRVFNDRLNRLWRDLFVRLAPMEDFVPAFRVPTEPITRVLPTLETRYRLGGAGGTPGAMLSAGNLNTAALTLFLALHLSVKPLLPWLILDDPVQSMDEVHISQLAALLRTLSKEHNRQVVLAVHDRALFDYLALELGPTFPGDELITVELGISAERQTRFATTRQPFVPDRGINPVAA